MKKQRGFTIIEVSLFLAISASLIVLTFGLSSMIARQRFQDTMVSLRGLIQAQYEETLAGINESAAGEESSPNITNCGSSVTGTSSKCVIIGRRIIFTNDSSNVSVSDVLVISDQLNTDTYFDEGDAFGAIYSGISRTEQIQWGGKFVGIATALKGTEYEAGKRFDGIVVVRSPRTGSVITYYRITNGTSASYKSVDAGDTMAIFIKNEQQGFEGAAICIDLGSASTNVRTAIPANPNIFTGSTEAQIKAHVKEICGV